MPEEKEPKFYCGWVQWADRKIAYLRTSLAAAEKEYEAIKRDEGFFWKNKFEAAESERAELAEKLKAKDDEIAALTERVEIAEKARAIDGMGYLLGWKERADKAEAIAEKIAKNADDEITVLNTVVDDWRTLLEEIRNDTGGIWLRRFKGKHGLLRDIINTALESKPAAPEGE